MNKEKNSSLPVILTAIILILAFVVLLGVLYKKGYLSFTTKGEQLETTNTNNEQTETTTDQTEKTTDNTTTDSNDTNSDKGSTSNNSNTSNNSVLTKASTNMTNNEVFALWKKIKGNWANVSYSNDLCVGSAVEINYFIQFSKFNSDGIINWSIVSYEKVNDSQYKVNLITPVDLINEMSGDIVAHYSTITIDISKLDKKILLVSRGGDGFSEYQYVGENKGEVKNLQYVDGGFTQDYYCDWYKNNH